MAVAVLPTWSAASKISPLPPGPGQRPDDESFVAGAAAAGRLFAPDLVAAIEAFADDPGPAGALLLQGVPTGTIPATPATPTSPTAKDLRSEQVLLAVARLLGEPVGYLPEHGGSIVQNLVPTKADIGRQTSTSSGVDLAFHTCLLYTSPSPRDS